MKIVITDHRFSQIDQERRAVEATGWQLVVGQAANDDQLIELCNDADGVLAGRARITERVIAAMKRCRVIVRYGIGVETIDISAATKYGIIVANVPDYCIDEVSDHAITFLLMLSRGMIPAMALAKQEHWSISKMPVLHRLRGQVCGLFGAGRIGSVIAQKASQMGMRVLVHDPYLDESRAQVLGVEPVSFDALLERSDFISLHAPLNDETRHIFGECAFHKMKNTAFIINTARGGLIDEDALVTSLDLGEISGAALDVMESESATPARAALANNPRVILTPHSAWLTDESRSALQARAVEQVISCLKGHTPYGLINNTVLPRRFRGS